jgi:hypothetical protein
VEKLTILQGPVAYKGCGERLTILQGPAEKNGLPAMPLLTPECIIFFLFIFEDSRQKRCTHTRETFSFKNLFMQKLCKNTYFLNITYNNFLYVYISAGYLNIQNYKVTHVLTISGNCPVIF